MLGINSGQLRHKVAFYSLERVSDGAGGHTTTEVLAFETLAKMTPLKSIGTIEAGKMVLIRPYQLIIRYSSSHIPTKDMKVDYRGDKFLIQEIEPQDDQKRTMKLVIVRE